MGKSVFVDPPVRYIGYCFAAWEAMKAILRTKPEKTFYVGGAVFIMLHALTNALEKGGAMSMFIAFLDTIIFEAIASVLVPIVVAKAAFDVSTHLLTELNIHYHVTKYGPAFVSLLCILLISQPLDTFTHKLLDKTVRTMYPGGWF